jgi:hypothetical protein
METHYHQNYLALLSVDGNFRLRCAAHARQPRLAINGGDGHDDDEIPELVQVDA